MARLKPCRDGRHKGVPRSNLPDLNAYFSEISTKSCPTLTLTMPTTTRRCRISSNMGMNWNSSGSQNTCAARMTLNYMGLVRSCGRLDRAVTRLEEMREWSDNLYRTSKPSSDLAELRNIRSSS